MWSLVLLPLFISCVFAQVGGCPKGCRACDSSNRCSECVDFLHLDQVNNLCKIGPVLARYITNAPAPEYQGIVNGHPRHRVPVDSKRVTDVAGRITDMMFIRNRDTSATRSILGVNHWYWTAGGDSSLYMWPTTNGGTPIDYSNIFSPVIGANVDIFDVRQLPVDRFRAKYNTTGPLVFEGVVGGFPRVKVPVTFISGPRGNNGDTDLNFFIFNRVTGDSYPIYGVANWLGSDGFLYFWSADSLAKQNTAALNALLPSGSTFWIMQMRQKCPPGCKTCPASGTTCTECMDGLFVNEQNLCSVGKVLDSYRTTRAPEYQGVVNGYPRWRIPVRNNFPEARTVQNDLGYNPSPTTFTYIRNRATGATRRIYGINHFWWSPDSSLYMWPIQSTAQLGQLPDIAAPFTPANDAPIDVFDILSIHPQKRRAQYQTTGGLSYQGVQGGFPRYKLPVAVLYRNSFTIDNTISPSLFLFNANSGRSVSIHGVNMWYSASDTSFYFWPSSAVGFDTKPFVDVVGQTGTVFWVVQYQRICSVVGCYECSSDTVCLQCQDGYYYDQRNNLCKIGVIQHRYTTTAPFTNEGRVNGFLRFRVPVSPARILAANGIAESNYVYMFNRGNSQHKRLYGINHYYWISDSSLYTWFADTIADVRPSGSWATIYPSVGTQVEVINVEAIDPRRWKARYLVNGGISYEGVVNGYPRYRVPVTLLWGDLKTLNDGAVNQMFFIFNEETGDSRWILGVNHWYWTSTHFYFWPVDAVASLNTAVWPNLLRSGGKFWVFSMTTPVCGNGRREELEDCDDGNLANGDGCTSVCSTEAGFRCPANGGACTPICGDNLLVRGETCDDGNLRNLDGCSVTCQIESGWNCPGGKNCQPICGDGLVRGLEACDDRNSINGDGCSSDCRRVEKGWQCLTPGSACVRAPIDCGNSILESAERCDDGNDKPSDGCSASCLVEAGWTCPTLGRPCLPICGDGVRMGNEACDDGNTRSSDGCSSNCTVESGWSCPNGAGKPCISRCGDGIKTSVEQCDDGNVVNFDGCTPTCTIQAGWVCPTPGRPCVAARCGDNIIAGAERCEDGNTANGDGCSSTCQREAGWLCSQVGKPCTPVCGDGLLRGGEICDDNNTLSGDGCSSACRVEEGWNCTRTERSICRSICGDGKIKGSEICDDRNTMDGDGCSSKCIQEEGFTCWATHAGACCRNLPQTFIDFICDDGVWRYKNATVRNFVFPDSFSVEDFEDTVHLCGYITIQNDWSLTNTNLWIHGSLTIDNNATLHLIGNSTVNISSHCLVSNEAEDFVNLKIESGGMVTLEGMDWPETSDNDTTYAEPRITVEYCANVGTGNFYLQAENIPSGSNPIPFIVSGSECINYNNEEDSEIVFEEITHDIPGTCSSIEATKMEDGSGNVAVVINMKHLCPGSIAAIVVCSILGAALALGLAAVALGGGGGGGVDDYAAL